MNPITPAYQVIRGGLLLDVQKQSVAPADVLIKGDTVIEIGQPGLMAPQTAVEIDASDRIVMPGLVNAHTHGHGSLGKGLGDKWSLELLLNAAPWTGGGFALEDKRTAALLNAAEMVLKGCTAAYDMYFEFPTPTADGLSAIGQAYAELGVRVVLAPMMADTTLYRAIPGLMEALPEAHRSHVEKIATANYDEHLAACARMLEDWSFDRDQVRPALGPTIPLHCSDDFIRGCRDLANDYEVGVQMHLAESKVQAVSGIKQYGKTLAAHLDDLGLLGPRFTGAHCIWLDDDDLLRMRDHGACVAHNPGSNLRLGSGIAPARQMINLKIGLGIGSDGSSSADNQNMFEAMRMAAFVSRVVTPDPCDWLGTWDVLELGTSGGAGVLGMGDRIGRIAPGFKADMVFLDLNNINFIPLNDVANQIVNCEDSSAVDSVMIGGRMILAARKFISFDYAELRRKTQAAVSRIRETNKETQGRMEAMAEFVSHHCVGLVCEDYHIERRLDSIPGGRLMDLIIKNVMLSNDSNETSADIGIADGKIIAIESALSGDAEILDMNGRLAIPGFVESHIHLDKACILDRCKSEEGTLDEAIREVSEAKKAFTIEDIRTRAIRTLEKCILQGTTRMRTHLEVDPIIGIKSIEAVLPLVAEYAWAIDLEICVFPQDGLLNNPGTDELMIEALKRGAHVVGGCPYTDSNPLGQIERIFEMAREFDVDIDFHLDFDTNPEGMTIGDVCHLTEAYGYAGRVAIGHVSKLSALPPEPLAIITGQMADAGVTVTVLPSTDLYLMGAGRSHDIVRGVAPVHRLIEGGVNCVLSTNNVLNPFTPFGDCSMIRMANLYANIGQIGTGAGLRTCLDMVTHRPARLLRIENYGIAVGNPADIVILDCPSGIAAVQELAAPLYGFKRGRRTFTRQPAQLHKP